MAGTSPAITKKASDLVRFRRRGALGAGRPRGGLVVADRQLVELVLQHRGGELGGGVELQHLRALQVRLRLVQFLLCRAVLAEFANFLLDRVDGVAGAGAARTGL